MFDDILKDQEANKAHLIKDRIHTPLGGITILINSNRIQTVIDGQGWVHPQRKLQFVALFENALKKYKIKNAIVNINISDFPLEGYFNFCRQNKNSKHFLLPNHRFTKDDVIVNTETFTDVVKYIRAKSEIYKNKIPKFYTNCVPHKSKVDYFLYALKHPQTCSGYVYGGSTHKFLQLPPPLVNQLKAHNLAGEHHVPFEEHCKYKYVIYNDGNVLSDRMRLLLCTDSVIVKKTSPYEEFYSYLLKPEINYISYTNTEELEEIFNRLEKDENLCNALRQNNANFLTVVLNYDNILEYVANLINAVC